MYEIPFKNTLLPFLLLWSAIGFSQIKIGDNPQNIDASSILELESTTRAFVINRVNTAQMNAIVPIEGAMVYNTDIQCLHYYDGSAWLNLCEALGLTITANPIKHDDPTIFITRADNNINIEVDSITGLQIVDRSIRREDIALGAIGGNLIQNQSVPITKIQPGPTNTILRTDLGGNLVWAASPISPIAFGKVNGNIALKISPVASVSGALNTPTVSLNPPRLDRNYTIQLTVYGNNQIRLINQNPGNFTVSITNDLGEAPTLPVEWYFTVFDF